MTNKSNKKTTKLSTIRVNEELAQKLQDELLSLNKTKKGSKKIKASDVLLLAINQLSDELRDTLCRQTVTSEDRQKIAFKSYKMKNRTATNGEFLELIQYGDIKIDDYLPHELRRPSSNSHSHNSSKASLN